MRTQSVKSIASIDIAKFIMAIFVIIIHTTDLRTSGIFAVNAISTTITDLAVPFFMTSCGYFCMERINRGGVDTSDILRSYICKMIKYYMIWNVIYLPLAIYGYVIDGIRFMRAVFLYVRNFFLIGEHYYSWPLWTLLSTIYAASFLFFLIRCRGKRKYILVASLILFLIGQFLSLVVSQDLLSQSFRMLIQHTIGNGRILSAAAFFLLGAILADFHSQMKWRTALILFGILIIIQILMFDNIIAYLLKYLITFINFELILSVNLRERQIYQKMRFMSKVIYFTHMYFLFFISLIVQNKTGLAWTKFVGTLLCTLLASIILEPHKKNRFVQLLFL